MRGRRAIPAEELAGREHLNLLVPPHRECVQGKYVMRGPLSPSVDDFEASDRANWQKVKWQGVFAWVAAIEVYLLMGIWMGWMDLPEANGQNAKTMILVGMICSSLLLSIWLNMRKKKAREKGERGAEAHRCRAEFALWRPGDKLAVRRNVNMILCGYEFDRFEGPQTIRVRGRDRLWEYIHLREEVREYANVSLQDRLESEESRYQQFLDQYRQEIESSSFGNDFLARTDCSLPKERRNR